MVLRRVGAIGGATRSDVLEGVTFSSLPEGVEAVGTIPNNGAGSIDGPNDVMAGEGYYASITNNIPDRGSITNITPGQFEPAGFYDGGTVPEPSYTTVIRVNGVNEGSFTQSSNNTYNVDVNLGTQKSLIAERVANTSTEESWSIKNISATESVANGSVTAYYFDAVEIENINSGQSSAKILTTGTGISDYNSFITSFADDWSQGQTIELPGGFYAEGGESGTVDRVSGRNVRIRTYTVEQTITGVTVTG